MHLINKSYVAKNVRVVGLEQVPVICDIQTTRPVALSEPDKIAVS